MKKYFVAYRFSGELPEVLHKRLSSVVDALGKSGIEAYCNLFDQADYERDQLTPQQIMEKAFAKIDESDGLFVLIASHERSEGQLIELGYALAKGKDVIVAAQDNISTYAPDLANQVIRWHDADDLRHKLEGLKP